MRLDRYANPGQQKYAVINLRKLDRRNSDIVEAFEVLERAGVLEMGNEPPREFFVLFLKDKFAADALRHYALSIDDDAGQQLEKGNTATFYELREYANDLHRLASEAAKLPGRRIPD